MKSLQMNSLIIRRTISNTKLGIGSLFSRLSPFIVDKQPLVDLMPYVANGMMIKREVLSTHDKEKNWVTLEDFGYQFNEKGELRDISTNGRFEFNIYKSHEDNQWRYERLGQVIEKYVYKLLEEEGKLLKVPIPVDHNDKEGKGFIFRSEDSHTCDKLLLIIHGSGVVRAGQWSRRLIINHSLESGTQLPYIKKAKELGFGILVLNSNQHYDEENGKKIRESSSPEEHFIYVWNEFVSKSAARHVAIVAHSFGGVITTKGAALLPDVVEKTFAVAFTDSVHYRVREIINPEQYALWMEQNVCNWVSSAKDLDEVLSLRDGDCIRVSAGTRVHEETSWKAFHSVWSFIEKQWNQLDKNVHNQTDALSLGENRSSTPMANSDSNEDGWAVSVTSKPTESSIAPSADQSKNGSPGHIIKDENPLSDNAAVEPKRKRSSDLKDDHMSDSTISARDTEL